MKKTQVKEVGKNIRNTFVSFISIVAFVSLGISIYLGLTWTAMTFRESLSKELNHFDVYDLRISFPYGISEEEVDEFLDIEEVDKAEGVKSVYQFITVDNETVVANIKSITREISTLDIKEGRLPEKENEIVIDFECADKFGLSLGDEVSFSGETAITDYELSKIRNYEEENLQEYIHTEDAHYFNSDSFIIVGTVESGEYLTTSAVAYGVSPSDSLQVSIIFYVEEEAFNEETFSGYNTLLIKNERSGNLSVFDDEYKELTDSLKEAVEEKTDEIASRGYEKVKENTDKIVEIVSLEIEEGKKEIEEAKLQLEKGEAQIEEVKEKLPEAKKQLDEAKLELDEAAGTLTAYQAKLAKGKEEYEKAQGLLNEYRNLAENSFSLINKIISDENSSLLSDIKKLAQFEDLYALMNLVNEDGLEVSTDNEKKLEECKDKVFLRTIQLLIDYLNLCKEELGRDEMASLLEKTEKIQVEFNKGSLTFSEAFKKIVDEGIIDQCISYYESVKEKTGPLYSNYKKDLKEIEEEFETVVNRLLESGEKKLIEAKAQIDAASDEIAVNEEKLYAGYDEWWEKSEEYSAGVKTLEENEKKLESAKEEIKSAEEKIQLALEQLEELQKAKESLVETDAIILTCFELPSVYTCNMVADCIDNEKYSLGGLFLVIALLICYSVITRNVNNDMKLLGTKKALGFYQREVTMSYLVYTGFALTSGLVLGILAGRFIVEPAIIAISSNGLFTFKINGDYFGFKDALLLSLLEILSLEAVTYFGCKEILSRKAIELLQGPKPPEGKKRFYESFKSWNRLSLLNKTIINNCFNDPRRVFAMLVGVSGCTALVIASLVFCFDVRNEFQYQENEIYNHDSFLYYNSDLDTKEKLKEFFKEVGIENTPVLRSDVYIGCEENDVMGGHLYVYEDEEEFYHLYHLTTMEGDMCEKGVVTLPESVEQAYGLSVGDKITITTLDGSIREVEVGAYYRQSSAFVDIIMSKEIYEDLFDKEYISNTFMVNTEGFDKEELKEKASLIEGYYYTYDLKSVFKTNAKIFDAVAVAIVAVYLIVSVLMAIFVLLNLMVTFVYEKKRELITLRINGFTKKQAHAYIYTDTILLTFIGILLGIGIGYATGCLAIKMFESKYMLFNRDCSIMIVVGAIVFTSLLTALMTGIALKKADQFSLTDINKN